jgi:hypothetical protein
MVRLGSFLKPSAVVPVFTVLATLVGCSASGSPEGSSAEAETATIASMTACPPANDPNCPSGSFAVTCADGSHEVDTVAAIQANHVCPTQPASTDPFDPASCLGAPMTREEAIARFKAGATTTALGALSVVGRQRSCNPVTGCGPWSAYDPLQYEVFGDKVDEIAFPEEVNGRDRASAELVVSGTNINLHLVDSQCSLGNFGEIPTLGEGTCRGLGSPNLTCDPLTVAIFHQSQVPGDVTSCSRSSIGLGSAAFAPNGTLTNHCLRLAASGSVQGSGNSTEIQAVVFAKF